MGKSYSLDLRDRVHEHVGGGASCRAASRHFSVSASFAVKLEQRARQTGSTLPARQGRPRGSGKLAAYTGLLTAWVDAEPDITMPELALKLKKAKGVNAHPASLSRALLAAGYSFKKNAAGIRMRAR
jgi:transposase